MTLDRHFFTQIGLDSGAITMLGTVVHSFRDPGEYRGTVHTGDQPEAPFYVSVDANCAVASANIDLAKLTDQDSHEIDRSACLDGVSRFVVHPKGYAAFHVSRGAGGFYVNVRRADEDENLKAYDSRELHEGDIFSGILIRPGTYSMRNLLSKARADITVAYPVVGEVAYSPPAPVNIECGAAINVRHIDLQPGQGFNVHAQGPMRIRVDLTKPDDGPGLRSVPSKGGRKKSAPLKD